jgi:hypothetical protein
MHEAGGSVPEVTAGWLLCIAGQASYCSKWAVRAV